MVVRERGGSHLGQFHGLSCSGGHSSDPRETGDIFTRERS
jgi:hypothetical protein